MGEGERSRWGPRLEPPVTSELRETDSDMPQW